MNKNNRPVLLSALCLLTFLGSSITFIGYFIASVLFEKVADIIINYSSWHSTEAISPVYFTALMVLSAISLTGAIRMWKLHRDGFYLYVFAQLIMVMLPAVWIGAQAFTVSNAIFTGVFILGYGLNLKHMR